MKRLIILVIGSGLSASLMAAGFKDSREIKEVNASEIQFSKELKIMKAPIVPMSKEVGEAGEIFILDSPDLGKAETVQVSYFGQLKSVPLAVTRPPPRSNSQKS